MSRPLPIINLTPFLPDASKIYPDDAAHLAAKLSVARSLYDACHEVGFFYLTGHGIPEDLRQGVLDEARKWFLSASEEEREKVKRWDQGKGPEGSGDGARGYQRIGENVTMGTKDWHEAIDLYRPVPFTPPPHTPIMGPNMWPSADSYPSFRPIFEKYIERILDLGYSMMRAMSLALHPFPPREDLFLPYLREPFWVMRIIGYPQLEGDGVSCGEHSDYGCTTFLLTDDTKGALQVRDKDGNWMNADPLPGAYVVNIGDMVETWTNGLWKSTKHRVVHKGTGYRVSVPFFFEPDWDARIKPLDVCLEKSGGHSKYPEVVYGEHLLGKVLGNFYSNLSEGEV